MSHHAFAALWMQLEMRIDIDNILCELIGRNSLESSVLLNDSDDLLNASLHLSVFLRVIFDLQRTYLQFPRPESRCPHLLQPSQLLFAIVYLLRIKSRVFRRSNDNSEGYIIKRSFIAQTLISGLRALWLRKHPFPPDKITQLRHAFEDAWEKDKLNGRDVFLVQGLCSKILDELAQLSIQQSGVPPSDLAQPACGRIQLRDYSTGLYPLESRNGDLVKPVQDASRCRRNTDSTWFENYWTLFDVAWSTEAAFIQLCINASRPRGAKVDPPDQGDIDYLNSTRAKVLETIFTSTTIETTISSSIAAILFTACFGRNCTCLQDLRAKLNRSNVTSTQSIFPEVSKPGKLNLEMDGHLNHSLALYAKVLENRKEELRDCNREITGLSESLDIFIDAWYSDISPIEAMDSTSRYAQRTAYIIPCPNLHPISYENLEKLIKQSAGQVGLQELKSNSALLDVDIACDQCNSEHRIRKARQIEPLRRLSATIREKLRRRPITQHETQPQAIYAEHPERNSSGSYDPIFPLHSRNDTGSSRTSVSEKGTKTTGVLSRFFDEHPLSTSSRPRFTSYCFSADGNCLLLWERTETNIAFYDIDTKDIDKFLASDVTLAAAGTNIYALVSQDRDGRHLFAYRRGDGERIAVIETNVSRVYCISVSRDDRYVAIGFDGLAWIYVIGSRQTYRHELTSIPNRSVDSQQICFSPDSEQIIVATRYREGIVCTYVGACTKPEENHSLPDVRIATGDGKDFGLSSVLYDGYSSHACITAFSRSKPPVLLALHHPPRVLGAAGLGTQIQCAAASPSGQKFTLVNHENHAFSVQRHASGAMGNWVVKRLDARVVRSTVSAKQDCMAVAMPDEDRIHLFWINGPEWVLMTI